MKEYEITELMRAYTDDEFGIEGENAADTDKVVESVMGQVTAKKKVKPLLKVIAAAAAAAVLTGATVLAVTLNGSFTTITGQQVDYEMDGDIGNIRVTPGEYKNVITLENGRLYFTTRNERTDVTELVNRDTPYILPYTNADTGKDAYLIAGGTPDNYGYVDLTYIADFGWHGAGFLNGDSTKSIITSAGDGWFMVVCSDYDDTNGNGRFDPDTDTFFPGHNHGGKDTLPFNWRSECDEAWLIDALEQLDLIELSGLSPHNPPAHRRGVILK